MTQKTKSTSISSYAGGILMPFFLVSCMRKSQQGSSKWTWPTWHMGHGLKQPNLDSNFFPHYIILRKDSQNFLPSTTLILLGKLYWTIVSLFSQDIAIFQRIFLNSGLGFLLRSAFNEFKSLCIPPKDRVNFFSHSNQPTSIYNIFIYFR